MKSAQPNYLKNTDEAAPGHRFGLYYAGWNDDFSKPKTGANDVLNSTVCKLPKHSRDLLAALTARQKAVALSLGAQIFTYPTIASAPFATGLGNEHPLENGFSFLSPYGLPYLPGSGIKGVLRRAAEELASGEWGETHGWNPENIRALFGPGEEDATRDAHPLQGALRFWDVFPTPPASIQNETALLCVEIMTPHHSDYYQNGNTPNTSESPTPLSFLAVTAEAGFTFHVECHPARLSPELQENWAKLIASAFTHAGKWLGFGAKTAVGYGRMALDPKVAEERKAAEAEETKRKAEVAEQERIAALPAEQSLLAELESMLARLPKDPRDGTPILQRGGSEKWKEILERLNSAPPSLASVTKPAREQLASEIKKRLSANFKVEGKAETEMKKTLSALRGN